MKTIAEILNHSRVKYLFEMFPGTVSGVVNLKNCGKCSIVIGTNEGGWEHVSVSPLDENIMPSWDDMSALKSIIWNDNEEAYQIMPKKTEYVNIKDNCLHLWKPIGHELYELVEGNNGRTED